MILIWLNHQHFSPGTTDKTSQTSQAIDNLERDASLKTQGAVDEGKRDVQEAVSVGGSYLGAAIDTVKVLSFLSPVFQLRLVLKSAALCFRATSHPASPVLLVPTPIPRRSKGLRRAVYITLYQLMIGIITQLFSSHEREITNKGLEIRRENIMYRTQLSARILLHEIFERGVV